MDDFIEIVVIPFTLCVVFLPPALIFAWWWLNICITWAHQLGVL